MDITQALTDAENSLRDFIASVLSRKLGTDWVEKCGVSADRLTKWRERKEAESKRQDAGVVDQRLIYYADFYDLRPILKEHWNGEFSEAFGDFRTMDVLLTELAKIRDPDAHRRGLLPHQEHLALGIAGVIGTKIIRYRSRMETADDCFPRIESAHDNLGNVWTPADSAMFMTRTKLRPGDSVKLFVTARDPEGLQLEYGVRLRSGDLNWQQSPEFTVLIHENCIGKNFRIELFIRSPRTYHASTFYDDTVDFYYTVLPLQRS